MTLIVTNKWSPLDRYVHDICLEGGIYKITK